MSSSKDTTTRYKLDDSFKALNTKQTKISLDNMENDEFKNSKYILTSPRSLHSCKNLRIKPVELLPKTLADIQDDLGGEKVSLNLIYQIYDQYEIERQEKLKKARHERRRLMKKSLEEIKIEIEKLLFKYQQNNDFEKFRNIDVLTDVFDIKSEQTIAELSRLHDLIKNHKKMSDELYAPKKYPHHHSHQQHPFHNHDELRLNSSMSSQFNPHVHFNDKKYLENLFKEAERIGELPRQTPDVLSTVSAELPVTQHPPLPPQPKNVSNNGPRVSKSAVTKIEAMQEIYGKALDNLKMKTEFRAKSADMRKSTPMNFDVRLTATSPVDRSSARGTNRTATQAAPTVPITYFDPDLTQFQNPRTVMAILDHETKMAKNLLNAKKIQEETAVERHKQFINDLFHFNRVNESREMYLKEKSRRIMSDRQMKKILQEENYKKVQEEKLLKKFLNLNKMKNKEQQSQNCKQQRENTMQFSRSLAKSAQDLRELYKDKTKSFDKMVTQAETSNLLGKSFHTGTKNQSSILIG